MCDVNLLQTTAAITIQKYARRLIVYQTVEFPVDIYIGAEDAVLEADPFKWDEDKRIYVEVNPDPEEGEDDRYGCPTMGPVYGEEPYDEDMYDEDMEDIERFCAKASAWGG
jgi:hypothetical protein